ncbi:MAG: pyridoxal 5'-phosphate synthase glutaminase subunit PdxT [candidate division Zixibacteria bacterium]|nr:pyridoxal 5'-phosphate synthase glutaminase subunit PdxT [candidate division Zixibacteria bacterium]MDH3936628.1 pyridoxal 5'-phosphate synthase glutaminase subunit PdxT [candidate division Zixibacteria bacterium]MDH4034834.1 pyridoxal 5'-phosphate synthase glutaminase subunit PdxT [candidate division Zixibacteria bacterium]
MSKKQPQIGVLALQGDFERHEHQLTLAGAEAVQVRLPSELEPLDGLIIPGGESTTMSYLIDRFAMRAPLVEFGRKRPVWGTCAGMIMLAAKIEDNQAGLKPFGLLDIDVVRNGYGRQVFSFTDHIEASLNGGCMRLEATFIRAPRITRLGAQIKTLAVYQDTPVLVAQGRILASSFHTELDNDLRLLEYFLTHFVGA